MSDIFQHLSQQVISPKAAIEPLRISHFTLFSESNLPLPNVTAPLTPPVRAARDVGLHKRARTLPDPLVADDVHTRNLALPSLRGIGHLANNDGGMLAQTVPLTTVDGNGEPGITELTTETLAPETPDNSASAPAIQSPRDAAAPHSSPTPTALQESPTILSSDGRSGSSLSTFQSASSPANPERSVEKAEFAFSHATVAAPENATAADSRDPLRSAQVSSAQSSQAGKPVTHRSTEISMTDIAAPISVKPVELRTQEEEMPSSIVQNGQLDILPIHAEANRTEVERGEAWSEHTPRTFIAETATTSAEQTISSRKEGAFITAPALRNESAEIPPALQPLTEAERPTASTLPPAHTPSERPEPPSPITATTAIGKVLPVTSVEAGDEERQAAAPRLQETQTNKPEQALSFLVQPANEPIDSASVQPRHFRERTATAEAALAGAVAPTLPPSAQASSIADQTIADHTSAYPVQPFAPSEQVAPAPLGGGDMASVQPIQTISNTPSSIQRAALDAPPARPVAQASHLSGSSANDRSVGAAENAAEISPQLPPVPQPQVPVATEQPLATEESMAVTNSVGEAALQRKPSAAAVNTTPGSMPITSANNPPVTPALPTAAAVPVTSLIAASELSPVAAMLSGNTYAAAPVGPLLPHSESAQPGTQQQSTDASKITEHENSLTIIAEPATFETTPRLYSTSDVSVTASSVQPAMPTMGEQPSSTPRSAAVEQMLTAASHIVPTRSVTIVQPIPAAEQPLSTQGALSRSEVRSPTLQGSAPSQSGHPASTAESIRTTSAALPQPPSQPMANEVLLEPSARGEVLPLRQEPIVSVPPISEQTDVQGQPSAEGSSVSLAHSNRMQQTHTTPIHSVPTVTSQTFAGSTPSGEPSHLEPALLQPLSEKNTRTLTKSDLPNLQQEPSKESAPETTPTSLSPVKALKVATIEPSVATQLTVQNDTHAATTVQPFIQTSIVPAALQVEIPAHETRPGPRSGAAALDETVFALTKHAAPEPLRGQTIVPSPPGSTNWMAKHETSVPVATATTESQHPEKVKIREAQPLDSSPSAPFAQENSASVQPQTRNFVPIRRVPAASSPEPLPTIHVTIGRVFVHTAAEPAKPVGPSRHVAPPLSLDAYLQQRRQEGR